MSKPAKLDYDKILCRANELYLAAKTEYIVSENKEYWVEILKIQSDQVKSMLRALVEAINNDI